MMREGGGDKKINKTICQVYKYDNVKAQFIIDFYFDKILEFEIIKNIYFT